MARIVKPGVPIIQRPKSSWAAMGPQGGSLGFVISRGDGVVWGNVGEDGKEEATEHCEKGAFRRILYAKPALSHEAGKGTDMLSVNQRK
ncbi:S-adenosyl-L-methionine-dependent methyltransferase [Penicillium atrosanguineum]|uniref:S-adenosyl-L-methionine-dependent methyltransferase n=1 Tax=Penicillium atrosanguineum TaxID=1132637 RepID=A0A9W9PVH4_9EURO|nr:S-adenosyl-L-methionine-dependent methyltransferase [Penicillium atrosanguineum]KAJ5311448.1 S-adenosyl-L-methionine-dependent methyltransferase [Penicillium atrosanguineum]